MGKQNISNNQLISIVKNTFNQVNEKIDGLIDCSVKDFVLLNTIFREYHNVLNDLSKSTGTFINKLSSSEITSEINSISEATDNYVKSQNSSAQNQLSILKSLSSKYSFILLSTNNLKQDLRTLHLLLTNLRFDPLVKIDHEKILGCFNDLLDCYQNHENRINNIYSKLKDVTVFVEETLTNGIDAYATIIEKIKSKTTYFSEVAKSITEIQPELTKIESQKKDSTSEIITNLQFQDILRQKIEHIQTAHTKITENLYSNSESDEGLGQKQLFQIRDISSLQSALLIHANQEYQSAVEVILHRIDVLKSVFNQYNTIWKQYCKPQKAKILNMMGAITEELSLLKSQTFALNQISENYNKLITEAGSLHNEVINQIADNNCICDNMEKLQKLMSIEELNTEQKYTPALQLKSELNKFQKSYEKLDTLLTELQKENLDTHFESIPQSKIELLTSQSQSLSGLITEFKQSIDIDLDMTEVSKVKSNYGIEQINYYKTFDKEVKEIIGILDSLLERVNLSKQEIDSDYLEDLKEMYTMQSERDIHNNLTEKDKSDDQAEDDDEVEFF